MKEEMDRESRLNKLKDEIRVQLIKRLTAEILISLPEDPTDRDVMRAVAKMICEFGHSVLPGDKCCDACEKTEAWAKANKTKIVGRSIPKAVKNIMEAYVKFLVERGKKFVRQVRKKHKELYT